MTSPEAIFTNSREFPVSPGDIFRAISDPEVLATWWGPKGFSNTFEQFDFREGGEWNFVMHSPEGRDFPNQSRFEQIVDNECVVIRHLCAPLFTLTLRLSPTENGALFEWEMAFDDQKTKEALEPICRPANEENLDRLEAALGLR